MRVLTTCSGELDLSSHMCKQAAVRAVGLHRMQASSGGFRIEDSIISPLSPNTSEYYTQQEKN